MLWVMAIVLGLLWVMALLSSYTFGGFVHVLIAAAVIVVAYQVIRNRQDNLFKKGV